MVMERFAVRPVQPDSNLLDRNSRICDFSIRWIRHLPITLFQWLQNIFSELSVAFLLIPLTSARYWGQYSEKSGLVFRFLVFGECLSVLSRSNSALA